MATRADYRTDLNAKLLGLEDSGYGDIDYSEAELNIYLSLAVARLWPGLYKRTRSSALTPTSYGTADKGYLTITQAEQAFMVEETTERDVVRGWEIRPSEIVNITYETGDTFYVYYYEPYTLPESDGTDDGISAVFRPLIVLGALIEALESRHDTGVRPDPTNGYIQSTFLDRLQRRWDELKQELAMPLPVVLS